MPETPIFFLRFSDAHAHLPEDAALDAFADVPADAKILLNCARAEDFPRVAALAEKFPANVVPAFGVHPWFAETWTAGTRRLLRNCLSDTRGAVVGEIGLDRARGNAADAATQETALREQLALAAELALPVTLHCVRAFGTTERILREFHAAGTLPPFLLHAYSGSAEQAKVFARLGGVFSAPRRTLPPECVVVPETDAPLPTRRR